MRSTARRDGAVATVLPEADAEVCVRHGCNVRDGLHAIDPHVDDFEKRVLCPEHGFEYLEEIAR